MTTVMLKTFAKLHQFGFPRFSFKSSRLLIGPEGKHLGAGRESCTAPAQAAGLRLQQIKAQIVIKSDGKRI